MMVHHINCIHSFSHMKSIYLLIYFFLEGWLWKWQQVRKCCRRWSAAAVTASHPCSSLCLMNLCLKWLKEAFGHLNFHSLWKFLLCDTIQDFTEKNGNAKDSWKAANHHYVSFTDLSLLHDPFFSGYVDILFTLLYYVLSSSKCLSNSLGNECSYGHTYLTKSNILLFGINYILSCNTALDTMAVQWQLLLWNAFSDLSGLQDPINHQGKCWSLNSKLLWTYSLN